jgi:hypothetical protein
MLAERQSKTWLNEINDFRAAVDEHTLAALFDWQGKTTRVNDKFCVISKHHRKELQ